MPAVAPSERSSVLKEEVSRAGRTVRLTLDKGTYKGAQPYYTVAYLRPSGGAQVLRYVPEAYGGNHQDIVSKHQCRQEASARAAWLFKRFLEDITDPAALSGYSTLSPASSFPEPEETPARRPCHDALELPPEWAASASPEPTNGRPSVS